MPTAITSCDIPHHTEPHLPTGVWTDPARAGRRGYGALGVDRGRGGHGGGESESAPDCRTGRTTEGRTSAESMEGGRSALGSGGPREASRLTKADSGGGAVHPVEPQGGPGAEAVETMGETEAQRRSVRPEAMWGGGSSAQTLPAQCLPGLREPRALDCGSPRPSAGPPPQGPGSHGLSSSSCETKGIVSRCPQRAVSE